MASQAKKAKLSSDSGDSQVFLNQIEKNRTSTAASVKDFKYNKKRVEILSNEIEMPESHSGVVYWMHRDCRVQDNWAFLFAQKLAMKAEVPLHVCFCLKLDELESTLRHLDFLLKGLQEVQEECNSNDIKFHLLEGSPVEVIPEWVKKHDIGALVCDFSPLRVPVSWVNGVKKNLSKSVPLIRVDAHNIVPCVVASDKLEYSARTIRNKINSKLDEYLTEFPPLIKHPHVSDVPTQKIDWKKLLAKHCTDDSVGPCSWATPGTKSGLSMLKSFCDKRLKIFSAKRNDPLGDAISNLSPWFRFGHISVQRAILCVKEYKSKCSESVASFCEEAIVRRELSDNFCYYNEHYDSLKGASNWAQTTLNDHRKDKREYVYTREEFLNSLTHDDLWNSAQIQLVKEGKIHGFLRMYWAKKILEWTPNPEKALEEALYFNDKYGFDGRDPNGFVGCMWSICGIHDQGWAERAVFGKIRFMNYAGCKRKFDINAFIARYGGKCHKYVKK